MSLNTFFIAALVVTGLAFQIFGFVTVATEAKMIRTLDKERRYQPKGRSQYINYMNLMERK